MKKILVALVALGFISTLCFAAETAKIAPKEPMKPIEAKAEKTEAKVEKTEMKTETKETVKKETRKAAKKGKKVNKKKAAAVVQQQ